MATDNFGVTTLIIGQAQKETTINNAFFEFDALTTGAEALANSPSVTTNGTVYMIDTAGSGDFAGQDNKLAIRINGGWVFKTIQSGFIIWNIVAQTLYRHDGTNWQEVTLGGGGGGGSIVGIAEFDLLHVRDEKAAGTAAANSSATTWNVREVNTVVTNEISGASLSSNQITLPAGTYEIDATAPAIDANGHKLRLRDTTGSTTIALGTTVYTVTTDAVSNLSRLTGRFTLSVESVLELQHWTTAGATSGLGLDTTAGSSELEVYADIHIRRIQPVLTSPGLPFKGALVKLTADESIATSTDVLIPWDAATYDTSSFFAGASPTKLTVPSGVSRVKLSGVIAWSATSSQNKRQALILKNGGSFSGYGQNIRIGPGSTASDSQRQGIVSAVVDVVAGDFFEIQVRQTSSGSRNVETPSWFAIEVVEGIAPSTKPRGALVNQATSFNLSNSTATTVSWDNEVYDTDEIHDNVTNNSRLTVPSGVTHVRLSGNYKDSNNTTGWRFIVVNKNGSSMDGAGSQSQSAAGANTHILNYNSGILEVVADDFFEMQAFQNSGGSTSLSGTEFWFAMEIVEPAVINGGDPAQVVQTLPDGANIAWEQNASRTAQVTLAGDRTLDNPTNGLEGLEYTLKVIQDGTGTRLLSYGSTYKFDGGTAPTLSTGVTDIDIMRFWFDGTNYNLITFKGNVS